MHEAMANILLDAYAQPDRRGFFYSANGAETGSARLNAMSHWDWTPAPSRYVGDDSTCTVPLALGCVPKRTSENRLWCEPCISDPSHVHSAVIPDVEDGQTGRILENIRNMVRTLPPGERIKEPDIQSPLGIAELMWDESFYIALIEEPDAVHALLDTITEFLVTYVQAIHAAAGERLNACGFPAIFSNHEGTMVADDTMSLVSPEMHMEFSVPYLNRLAAACGPLYYHSCTWRVPYFENIRAIENVRTYNWNPGNSDDPAVLIRAFSGRAVLALHLVADMHRDNDVLALGRDFADEAEFLRYMIDAMQDDTCLHVWFSNIVQKGDVLEAIYDMLHEMGFTPQAQGIA